MPIAAKPLTPAPMPSTQRPPDISSTDAAAVAVRAGWRTKGSVTIAPILMRSVRHASRVMLA